MIEAPRPRKALPGKGDLGRRDDEIRTTCERAVLSRTIDRTDVTRFTRVTVLAAALLCLPAAAAAAEAAPICTDRPSKGNGVCTAPPGRLQLEANLAGWSLTRSGETRSELMSTGQSFIKVGLSRRSDLQIGFTPYTRLTVTDRGAHSRTTGFGDIVVRYKQRLTSDKAPVQVAALPSVKLPTASAGLGNDKVEGGIAVPVSFQLVGPLTLSLGPELDLLADADGHGRHLALVNLVNLSATVAPRLTLAGELWSNFNFDPAGTIQQASLDGALAYAVSDDLQLDIGGNLGLTRNTPDLEFYAGASIRF